MENSTSDFAADTATGEESPVLSYWPRLPRQRSALDSMDILLTVVCAIFILLSVSLLVTLRIVSGHWG